MNCDGVRGLLSAYVDGELSAGELLRVEQHLRRCHWCADEVDALRQTIALVATLEEVEVPAAFHAQLHSRLVALGPPVQAARTATAHRARRQDFRRWAVPAAAAAALVIGMAGLNRMNPPLPGPAPAFQAKDPGTVAQQPGDTGSQIASTGNGSEVKGTGTTEQHPVQETGGKTQQPPTQTKTPDPDPVNAPVESNHTNTSTNPATPTFGDTNPRSQVYTATLMPSFTTDIDEPASLVTQKQLSAKVEATVMEPAELADVLKGYFGANAVVHSDPVTGIVGLQVTVDARSYAEKLAFVEEQTGGKAQDTSIALDSDLEAAYTALAQLDRQREEVNQQLEGVTDAKLIEAGEATLAELKLQADVAREDYQKLVKQLANGTIEVTLKPKAR